MSDVATGSDAALRLQQNMAAAPDVQQAQANAMQAQQVKLQQDQANLEKSKLSNLASSYGIKAAEDSKQKLQALVQTPDFKTGDEVKKLRLISQVQAETNDMDGFVKTIAGIESAELKQVQTDLKAREASALTIGNAYASIKDAAPEQFGSMLEQMPVEQRKAIEAQIPNFFQENNPKLQKSQLQALFENTSGKNLLATNELRTKITEMQKEWHEAETKLKEEIARNKATKGADDKETALEIKEYNSYNRRAGSIDNSNKKEITLLEDEYRAAAKKDNEKHGVLSYFTGGTSAIESSKDDKTGKAYSNLASTKAWEALQEKRKDVIQQKLDALEALPEGKEKDRLYDNLQKQLKATELAPGEKQEQNKEAAKEKPVAKEDVTSNKPTPKLTGLGIKTNPISSVPPNKEQLMDGNYYVTKKGTLKWDAKTQTFVE